MEMGLRPWEFERLTPYEYEDMLAGYYARQQEEWKRAAWMVHWILSAWQKAPTPDELLGHVVEGIEYDPDEDGDAPSEPPPA